MGQEPKTRNQRDTEQRPWLRVPRRAVEVVVDFSSSLSIAPSPHCAMTRIPRNLFDNVVQEITGAPFVPTPPQEPGAKDERSCELLVVADSSILIGHQPVR